MLEVDRAFLDSNPDDPRITLASIANGLQRIAAETSEWAGIPLPLNGHTLTVEPSYPFAGAFNLDINSMTRRNGTSMHVCRTEDVVEETALRNRFWTWKYRGEVAIWQVGNKIKWGILPAVHGFPLLLETLGCALAWSLETEFKALETLRSLITHNAFRQYLLTGTFIETSRRSHVIYVFRRLRPTVALTANTPDGEVRGLCALCLHPIAYYQDSWAGAMCPTDDVIAHLMLMRGDERMFWKRANQHELHRREAGLY